MFDVFCPTHGGRVQLGPRSILAVAEAADGVVVRWRCRCGDSGIERFHGRRPADLPYVPSR